MKLYSDKSEVATDHWTARCDSVGSQFLPWHHSSDPAASAAQRQEAGDRGTEACSITLSAERNLIWTINLLLLSSSVNKVIY